LQGRTSEGNDRIPFGSPRAWNEDDNFAYITSLKIDDKDLIIDLDFSEIDDDALGDTAGNSNVGITIHDYRINVDEELLPVKDDYPLQIYLGQRNDRKAF
jgi:hypothetical protein